MTGEFNFAVRNEVMERWDIKRDLKESEGSKRAPVRMSVTLSNSRITHLLLCGSS